MLKRLDKKEVGRILKLLKEQYEVKDFFLDFLRKEFEWYSNKEGKVFLLDYNSSKLLEDLKRYGIHTNAGMYFCKIEKGNEVRLSVEGSQLLGYLSKRNVVEISREAFFKWMQGFELQYPEDIKGFVLLKFKKYFLGSGKVKRGKILNYLPKHRRITI